MTKHVITNTTGGRVPIKMWTDPEGVEATAMQQLRDLSRLPFIARNGIAVMPDVHWGNGTSVGTVLATDRAIVPAAVGVDIGCGMVALRTSLYASQLPDSLNALRSSIEAAIPLGPGGAHDLEKNPRFFGAHIVNIPASVVNDVFGGDLARAEKKYLPQLGSLGSGNHFIELCLDEEQRVWVMLHSGSRGVGNMIGQVYITKAKDLMEQMRIELPDPNLSYLPEGHPLFDAYIAGMLWAQDYAKNNRAEMLRHVMAALAAWAPAFTVEDEAINCHHNYAEKENHFGQNLWITRKGAVRARADDLGIIPGSMGQRSYIVRGKGNAESYCSCSHGAGRVMSRSAARKRFTVADLKAQTEGVECRKDDSVLDEIPSSYKNIDEVMAHQHELVEIVHTLKQVMCVKGG